MPQDCVNKEKRLGFVFNNMQLLRQHKAECTVETQTNQASDTQHLLSESLPTQCVLGGTKQRSWEGRNLN